MPEIFASIPLPGKLVLYNAEPLLQFGHIPTLGGQTEHRRHLLDQQVDISSHVKSFQERRFTGAVGT